MLGPVAGTVIDERTRQEARRVCTHVIARERHGRTGRIGLAWTGTGVGTDAVELRAGGLHRAADGADLPLTTLGAAAAFAGVDLGTPFGVGSDTPAVGDPDARLGLDPAGLAGLLGFYERAWRVLGAVADGAPITLWPEHFDAAFVWRERANVGASPGDATSPVPYVYVGPWGPERPGPASAWNAPFGALLPAAAPEAELVAFVRDRLALLAAQPPA
jgi:hypothetical protein